MRAFKFFISIFALTILVFSFGCKKNKKTTPAQNQEATTVQDSEYFKVFYLVPSPDDIFGFANAPNLTFKQELLNPVSNLDKYNSTKLQEINFGVYSADLAYSAAFGKKQFTKQYLQAVKAISEKIGLSTVFNESLEQRIENLGTNKDSLMAISNDTYFDIIRYLERTDRINTLALLAAGGWLETMYLVVNLVEYKEHDPTVQQIADQKLIFNNLYKFLEQNLSDPNVKSVYDDFKPLKEIYDQLKIIKLPEQENLQVTNDKIIVGGNFKIVMTKEQFYKLRDVIIKIRNQLTLNNQ